MAELERVLWHQSGVNRKGEPFVQLLINEDVVCQLTPEEARDHAKNILEATEASEQDAFMLEFFQKELHQDVKTAMLMIVQFRKWREARGKKSPPSDPKEFVRTDKHEGGARPSTRASSYALEAGATAHYGRSTLSGNWRQETGALP